MVKIKFKRDSKLVSVTAINLPHKFLPAIIILKTNEIKENIQ